jgi:hypothetical protein
MTIVSRPSVHGSYIDLQKNELRNAVIQVLAADPGSPTDGQIYYNSVSDRFRLYANGSWEDLATMDDVTAGGISVSTFDTKGDLLAATGNDAVDNLPAGANGTILVANSAQAMGLEWRTLTEADIILSTTDRLVGRDTAAGGAAEEITVGGGIEFTGSGGIQTSALTGDVTKAAGSTTTAIGAGVIVDADVNASAGIAATKLGVTATDRLLGRDTAAAGAVEELTVGGGIEFTGSGGIQRSALTGNVTAPAGSNTTTIANGVVTLAMHANMTTDRLLGRDTAGSGAPEELIVSGGLEFTGTGIQRSALTGDITASAGSNTTAIAAGVIVDADVNASAAIAATKLAFTPTGNIAATTVQAAIAELETDLTALINSTVEARTWKDPVDAVLTTALPNTPTYSSGAGTLTAGANAAFPTVDGVTAVAGQDYLIIGQASSFQNGIYTLTTLGSGAAPWVLTRRADASTATELRDATVMVEAGTTLGGDIYTQTNQTLADLTAASQTWTKTGDTNTVYTADGTTITLTGNQFAVASGGITGTQLNASVAGSGLAGGGGSALSVNVDTTTIEINSDTLRIAASAAGNGLTGGGGSALAVNTGTGLEISGDAVRLATQGTGIAGGAGSTLSIDTAVVVRKYAVDIGNGSLTAFTITHNFGTRDVTWSCYDNTTFEEYIPEVVHTTTNTLTATFSGVTPTSNQLRFVVHG